MKPKPESVRRFARECAEQGVNPIDLLQEMNKREESCACCGKPDPKMLSLEQWFCDRRCHYIYAMGLDLV